MSGLRQGLCWLPVFLVAWSASNFIVPYVIAVWRQDVSAILPYISTAGATPPESCIFGLMAVITACAAFATVYARYKFVERLLAGTSRPSPRLNSASLLLGLCSCLGMCVVASFPESTVLVVHDIGAFLFFVSGVAYIVLQTVLGCQLAPHGSTLCWVRSSLVAVAMLALVSAIVCGSLQSPTDPSPVPDRQSDPLQVASAACEWTLAFSFVCFFLTFIDEFKLFSLRVRVEYTEES
ncbi:DNA damage-regulated autophagy modulator protein 1 [Neosynchiropus ocellatus]